MGMAKLLFCALAAGTPLMAVAQAPSEPPVAHVSNSFEFSLDTSYEKVVPLFGPESEKAWAGTDWNPTFLYPNPGHDVEGSVFSVAHGSHTSVWVNTVFDLEQGKMQYVSFVPEVAVTVVDVRVTRGATGTLVHVTYTRTALQTATSEVVEALGARDRTSAEEWRSGLSAFLESQH